MIPSAFFPVWHAQNQADHKKKMKTIKKKIYNHNNNKAIQSRTAYPENIHHPITVSHFQTLIYLKRLKKGGKKRERGTPGKKKKKKLFVKSNPN